MRVGFVEGVVAFSFMFNVCSFLLMLLRGCFLASFVWTCSLLESGWWGLWWLECLVSRYAYVGEGSVECAHILHFHRFMCPICLVLHPPLRGLLGFPDGTSGKSQTDNCHTETKDLIWRCFAKLRFGSKSAQTTNMLGQVLREGAIGIEFGLTCLETMHEAWIRSWPALLHRSPTHRNG